VFAGHSDYGQHGGIAVSKRIVLCAVLGIALLCGGAPVRAHHGAATFDTVGEITIKGTVTEWVWSNPHSVLKLDVKEADGTVKAWSVATSNVADLSKRGWSRRTFKPGEEVTVLIQPAKSGQPVGMIRSVMMADGRKLQ
jgi:uncharacterized protein (DUF2345 family)